MRQFKYEDDIYIYKTVIKCILKVKNIIMYMEELVFNLGYQYNIKIRHLIMIWNIKMAFLK